MVPATAPIRKLRVGGRSRRNAGFCRWKRPVSASLHRGLATPGYDFALGIGDELVSYTVKPPRKSPTRYFAHCNHLFSVAATTNTFGQVVEKYSYNAYGVQTVRNSANAVISKSAVGQDRGFTGYKIDYETGLYFARSRMYSQKYGRFYNRMPWHRLLGTQIIMSNYGLAFIPNWRQFKDWVMNGNGMYMQERFNTYDFAKVDPANRTEPFSGTTINPERAGNAAVADIIRDFINPDGGTPEGDKDKEKVPDLPSPKNPKVPDPPKPTDPTKNCPDNKNTGLPPNQSESGK